MASENANEQKRRLNDNELSYLVSRMLRERDLLKPSFEFKVFESNVLENYDAEEFFQVKKILCELLKLDADEEETNEMLEENAFGTAYRIPRHKPYASFVGDIDAIDVEKFLLYVSLANYIIAAFFWFTLIGLTIPLVLGNPVVLIPAIVFLGLVTVPTVIALSTMIAAFAFRGCQLFSEHWHRKKIDPNHPKLFTLTDENIKSIESNQLDLLKIRISLILCRDKLTFLRFNDNKSSAIRTLQRFFGKPHEESLKVMEEIEQLKNGALDTFQYGSYSLKM